MKRDFFKNVIIRFHFKKFSILDSILEISSNITGSQSAFTPDDSIRDTLAFKTVVLQEEYNLSDYPDDILSFEKNFRRN